MKSQTWKDTLSSLRDLIQEYEQREELSETTIQRMQQQISEMEKERHEKDQEIEQLQLVISSFHRELNDSLMTKCWWCQFKKHSSSK